MVIVFLSFSWFLPTWDAFKTIWDDTQRICLVLSLFLKNHLTFT